MIKYTHRIENRRISYDRSVNIWRLDTLNPNHHNIILSSETCSDRKESYRWMKTGSKYRKGFSEVNA